MVVQGIQNDFISPGGGCDVRGCRYDRKQVATILPRIKEVVAAARNKNVPVVFLRTTSLPGDLTSSDVLRHQRANAGGPQPALAVEGARGAEFIDELKPAAGDIVLPVYRPDAFFGTLWIHSEVERHQDRRVSRHRRRYHGRPDTEPRMYLGYFRIAVSDAILSGKPARVPFTTTYLNSALPRTSREVVDIWSRHAARLR